MTLRNRRSSIADPAFATAAQGTATGLGLETHLLGGLGEYSPERAVRIARLAGRVFTVRPRGFDYGLLESSGVESLRDVQREIREDVQGDAKAAFERITINGLGKQAVVIDITAERSLGRHLRRRLARFDPLVLGEESLRDPGLDLTGLDRLVILVDAIDGTDLLERGFGTWCSAVTMFHPASRRILAAMVALPCGTVYAANERSETVKYEPKSAKPILVSGPDTCTGLQDASIAFYGQKPDRLAMLSEAGFFRALDQVRDQNSGGRLRIYTFGGNPAMVRMIDGASRMHVVFDACGQAPHDMVPGAFLAVRAGSAMLDLKGNAFDWMTPLLRPAHRSSRCKYVLGATQELALSFGRMLAGDSSAPAI